MQVATGALSTLLPKLGSLLKEEYKLQKGVRGEIMFLTAELESMQTALLEVSDFPIDQPPNRQVKLWAREVRELSYDLEDKIDKFMVRVDHAPNQLHGLRGFIDKSINLLTRAKIRHKICTDIKDIKTRIKEVRERRDSYKVDHAAAKPIGESVHSLRQKALYKKITDLVGTEEKSNDIVKRLIEQDEATKKKLTIISIYGMGGLGKTTLAKVVYEKVKALSGQFDCSAFVTVSFNPLIDKIFKTMLYQLDKTKYTDIHEKSWDEAQLIQELRDHLRDRRYFIVVDDIWDKSVWETIRCALIDNELGSTIITTTRNSNLARIAGGAYQLEHLSSIESRKLFYLRIFGAEEKCLPNELARVSEKILNKCGGIPLAIITIASMLASKKEKEYMCEYWLQVYRSMGSGLEEGSDVKDMRRILSVSYYDLPLHLRTCLLYLRLYPEDYEIKKEDLILKWIGEGFIPKEQGKSMYEVGEDYIYELIDRSLLQPTSIKDYYCLHDMVLDLINCLANENQLLTALDGTRPMDLTSKIRRLVLQTYIEKDIEQLLKVSLSHVRSLIFLSRDCRFISLVQALSSFPVLRVLDLRFNDKVDNHHFKVICNLFHLRCLVLHSTGITEIPKEIGNLKFLQVLDIMETAILKLPPSFLQLQQLVYLKFRELLSIPEGFGNLKSLQQLIGKLHLKSPTMLRILVELTELRSVDLYFYEWDESDKKIFLWWLSRMVRLKYLSINGEVNIELGSPSDTLSPRLEQLHVTEIFCIVTSIPMWMSSLSMLSKLYVGLLTLRQEDLQVLGSIPSLSDLNIHIRRPEQGRVKKLSIASGYPFLSLRKFEITHNTELMFEQGSMQNIKSLRFTVNNTMDQFRDFDFGLENLSSLEHVIVTLHLSDAKPEEAKAAESALQKAVDMNPNKPRLEIVNVFTLKLDITSWQDSTPKRVLRIVSGRGIESVAVNHYSRKLKVYGKVTPYSIIDKLKAEGIQTEPWVLTVPTTSNDHANVPFSEIEST
ncbi:hypothetical protein ACP4OV_027202 [Aristida adscensionis]